MKKEQIEKQIELIELLSIWDEFNISHGVRSPSHEHFYKTEITELQKQLKEMGNTEETQDQIPTKDELLAAGANESVYNTGYFDFNISGEVIGDLGVSLNYNEIYIDSDLSSEIQILNLKPTKKNISNLYTMFTGKPLDFTVKEKDYSWEAVLDRQSEALKFNTTSTICYFSHRFDLMGEAICKKLIALLKLHYIIEELDKDFEHTRAHFVYYDCEESELTHSGYGLEYPSGAIVIQSEIAAKKLIETNPQLLKDALGIVETEK